MSSISIARARYTPPFLLPVSPDFRYTWDSSEIRVLESWEDLLPVTASSIVEYTSAISMVIWRAPCCGRPYSHPRHEGAPITREGNIDHARQENPVQLYEDIEVVPPVSTASKVLGMSGPQASPPPIPNAWIVLQLASFVGIWMVRELTVKTRMMMRR